jgi:hypothetical protein
MAIVGGRPNNRQVVPYLMVRDGRAALEFYQTPTNSCRRCQRTNSCICPPAGQRCAIPSGADSGQTFPNLIREGLAEIRQSEKIYL